MVGANWVKKLDKIASLKKVPFAEAQRQLLAYIQGRRDGSIKSIVSRFVRLNGYLMDGFEENTIATIMALSGAGKTTLSGILMRDIFDVNLNPDMNAELLSFNFEMLCMHLLGRQVSKETRLTSQQLFSAGLQPGSTDNKILTDIQFAKVQETIENLTNPFVHFIEVSGTADQICKTILEHWRTYCKPTGKLLVYIIDHILLTQGREGSNERKRIAEVMDKLLVLKKYIKDEGGRTFGIVLSQMNRDIQSFERKKNPEGHYPQTSDLFGASATEQASDYIICYHMPKKIGISSYTPENLPTSIEIWKNGVFKEETNVIYTHLLKNRSGTPGVIIPMKNKLHNFNLEEWDLEAFEKIHEGFLDTKKAIYNVSTNRPAA